MDTLRPMPGPGSAFVDRPQQFKGGIQVDDYDPSRLAKKKVWVHKITK